MPFVRLSLLAVVCAASLPAVDGLVVAGQRYAVIDAVHLRAYVPATIATDLAPTVRLADDLYGLLIRRCGRPPDHRLVLVLDDRGDLHNGFNVQVPYPLVSLNLASPRPEDLVFTGPAYLERTLLHEFTHQLANDRNHGVRGVLEQIVGRVIPADPLSLLVFYLSTPAHQTMPAFWQEGLAQWVETVCSDPASPWSGRGRDPLVHMHYRLDALAGSVPEVGDWRLTHEVWPYGNQAYLYGLAYARHLAAAGCDLWELVDHQARRWPFFFNGAPKPLLGASHARLISQARAALVAEQVRQIAALRSQPVTTARRLTPGDHQVGAPAWLPDGRLACALAGPRRTARIVLVDDAGNIERTGLPGHAAFGVRSLIDGSLLYHDLDRHGAVTARWRDAAGSDHPLGAHLLQSDAQVVGTGARLAAIRFHRIGRQDLVIAEGADPGHPGVWTTLAVEGQPWSPAWRPGHRQLAWVEAVREGSRLVLADPSRPEARRELVSVRGRILHPAWSADGRRLFYGADHTGVANAWCIEIGDDGVAAEARPVTNTLGGVISCVPSPDGTSLAIVDHDRHGPFLAIISADRATWPERLPVITHDFPADPIGLPPAEAAPPLPDPVPYRGWATIRPRFWSPSLAVAPGGGYGIVGLATDDLQTHVLSTGLGVGPVEGEVVGHAAWAYGGWPLDIAGVASRAEATWYDQLVTQGGIRDDYTETILRGEIRVGRGILGLERRAFAWLSAGAADHDAVDPIDNYGRRPPVAGAEWFAGAALGYDDTTFFPDGYARSSGITALATWTSSVFPESDRRRDVATLDAGAAIPVIPAWNHQIVLRGSVGWSDGDEILQDAFMIGGLFGNGWPRGYFNEEAYGRNRLAWGVSYQAPVWRPFLGVGSSPLVLRQVFIEGFFEAAKVSDDRPGGDRGYGGLPAEWYRSVGAMGRFSMEFWGNLLQPGVGVARQLDGEEDTLLLIDLGITF